MRNKTNWKFLIVIIILAIIIGIGIFEYFKLNKDINWQTYSYAKNAYSFKMDVPSDWFIETNEAYTDEIITKNLEECENDLELDNYRRSVGNIKFKSYDYRNPDDPESSPSSIASGGIVEVLIQCDPCKNCTKPESETQISERTISTIYSNGFRYIVFHNNLTFWLDLSIYIKPGTPPAEEQKIKNNLLNIFSQMIPTFLILR